jgi:hypothetical protein
MGDEFKQRNMKLQTQLISRGGKLTPYLKSSRAERFHQIKQPMVLAVLLARA